MEVQVYIKTEIWSDNRMTVGQKYGETERQVSLRQKDSETEGQKEKKTQTERQKDRKTNSQKDEYISSFQSDIISIVAVNLKYLSSCH